MSQRAIQERLEQALNGKPQTVPPLPAMLCEMVSFADLEDLLVRGCRNPTNRIAVSHYVRRMSGNAKRRRADATLLELSAVLAIAAQPPCPAEGHMT